MKRTAWLLAVLAFFTVSVALIVSVYRGYTPAKLFQPDYSMDNIETWADTVVTVNNLDEGLQPVDDVANGTWYNATVKRLGNRWTEITGFKKGVTTNIDSPTVHTFQAERRFSYSSQTNNKTKKTVRTITLPDGTKRYEPVP
jgi:hypothetical protein